MIKDAGVLSRIGSPQISAISLFCTRQTSSISQYKHNQLQKYDQDLFTAYQKISWFSLKLYFSMSKMVWKKGTFTLMLMILTLILLLLICSITDLFPVVSFLLDFMLYCKTALISLQQLGSHQKIDFLECHLFSKTFILESCKQKTQNVIFRQLYQEKYQFQATILQYAAYRNDDSLDFVSQQWQVCRCFLSPTFSNARLFSVWVTDTNLTMHES